MSWTPSGGDFDSFVIEITNLENLEESQNHTLSGGALSLAVSGLNPNTSYVVGLFGLRGDSVLEPVYAEATTGTCSRQRCSHPSSRSLTSPLTSAARESLILTNTSPIVL